MPRITNAWMSITMRIVFLPLVIAALLLLPLVANAQIPPTGSISGRLINQTCGLEICPDAYEVLAVPVDAEQPITLEDYFAYSRATETDGTFEILERADGEYLLAPLIPTAEEIITPLPETVTLAFALPSGATSLGAIRVEVVDGQATSGIEIFFRTPGSTPVPNGVVTPTTPTATVVTVTLPPTGSGPAPSQGVTPLVSGAITLVAGSLLLLAYRARHGGPTQ